MAENKKDSFTFSDKIKNSKPAFNPFSKRASSKIGNNGKPKKTLFERTRRDAPFFVAAAAALLMLPFLYKYSGSINEGVIVPPGSEDSVFDPERYGFEPSVEDPNGQIAQLAGRDPLSLIKGWGTPEEEPVYDFDHSRDGLDDNYTPAPATTTPYRQAAPAATRAAFQRQATKVKELGSASMNLRGGGGAGFGRFGGANLKAAARQNSAGGPRQGAKPVSLQPLRAAGNPSRSYFGQGGAAQARASRDAMGKANAAEALRDAMFKPVETGRLGGLGTGDFAAGGGAGKMDVTYDYKGITPWWWDMMKERSQLEWRLWFDLKKKVLDTLVGAAVEDLVRLLRCVAWGNPDGDMDTFFGGGSSTAEATCCGIKKKDWPTSNSDWAEFNEGNCKKRIKNDTQWAKDRKCDQEGWKGGHEYAAGKGPIGARLACFGANWNGGKNAGPNALKDRFNCEAVDTTHNFELQTQGKANGWYTYHIIVAKNYAPFNGAQNLCDAPLINYNKRSGSGMGNNDASRSGNRAINEQRTASSVSMGDAERGMGLVKENTNDGCVIYVAEGDVLDWNNFQVQTKELLRSLYPNQKPAESSAQDGKVVDPYDKAFANMRLYFIEGFAMKNKLSRGAVKITNSKGKTVKVRGMPVERLPMTYVDFETNFILRRNASAAPEAGEGAKFRDNERRFADTFTNPADGSTRTTLENVTKENLGKENALRTVCPFSDFQIKAVSIETPSNLQSVLTFNPNVYGDGSGIKVDMEVHGLKGGRLLFKQDNVSKGPGQNGRADISVPVTPAQQKLMEEDGDVDVRWIASVGEKESKDNTGYTPVAFEEKTGIEDPKPRTINPNSLTAGTTTFASRLSDIPAQPTQRKAVAEETRTVPGGQSISRDELVGKAGMKISYAPDAYTVLAPGAESLFTGNKDCLGDKAYYVVESDEAKAYVNAVKDAYNAAHGKELPISYDGGYPTIAHFVDAMNIAQELNLSGSGLSQGKVPAAALCQLSRLVGTLAADTTISNTKKPEYNNMFGTFTSYISDNAAYFPAKYARDSQEEDSLNPRFVASSYKKYVGQRYHYGEYVTSADGYGKTGYKSSIQARTQACQKAGIKGCRDYPLAALEFLAPLPQPKRESEVEQPNRRTYWAQLYKVAQQGCDGYYGQKKMDTRDALAYMQTVCVVGLDFKPVNSNKTGAAGYTISSSSSKTAAYGSSGSDNTEESLTTKLRQKGN